MPAASAIIGPVVMSLLLQGIIPGPTNLQVGEGTPIPSAIIVPKGTVIPIQLLTKISTKYVKEGAGVYGMTIYPITLNNEIVIPVGTNVRGKITQVQRPGKVKGKAGLALSFQSMTFPSGSTISLYASLVGSSEAASSAEGKLEGESTASDDAVTMIKTAGVPAAVGAVTHGRRGAGIGAAAGASIGLATVLLTRGKDIELDRGSTLEIVLDRPLEP